MGHDSIPLGAPADLSHSSVSEWLASLKQGGITAPDKIWHRYVEDLVHAANRCLKNLPRRAADSEDIAQEVFDAFFSRIRTGRFSKLEDRDDLWQILLMLTKRRATDWLRHELAPIRGGGHVRGDSAMSPRDAMRSDDACGFDELAAPPATPESAEQLARLIQDCFAELTDDDLKQIALARAANFTIKEIAIQRGRSEAAIRRKLDRILQIIQRTASR